MTLVRKIQKAEAELESMYAKCKDCPHGRCGTCEHSGRVVAKELELDELESMSEGRSFFAVEFADYEGRHPRHYTRVFESQAEFDAYCETMGVGRGGLFIGEISGTGTREEAVMLAAYM